ncbi:Fungal Zn binuclear cluster domain containing protein [Diplocarpon rosae]|nr:Fungal Zn binuclear cluster domain containing protein [Diplocarpon rosae]
MSDRQPLEKIRAACDRCRAQKLRCLRIDGHPNFSCIRCVRCQADCRTRPPRRPGRPSRKPSVAVPAPQPTDPYPTPDARNESTQSLDAMLPTVVDDWFNIGLFNSGSHTRSASWDSGEMYSHESSFLGHTYSPSDPTDESSSPIVPAELLEATLNDHILSLPSEKDDLPPPLDHEIHVSVLYRDLSKLLVMLESKPWDMAEVMRVTCVHDACGDYGHSFPLNLHSNPLSLIAKSSEEFAQLLRAVQNPLVNELNDSPVDANLHSSERPCLIVSDLLGTLACHLLIVSIYDSIFQHFIDQYLHDPGVVQMAMQCAPQLFLGGIAVPSEPNMLGNLLLRLVESQLRPIELLLGLPDEFCVVLKRNSATNDREIGIFSGQARRSLFAALVHVEMDSGSQGTRGGVINALKDKARRIQVLN